MANLKPALRELAARSEQITEFARGSYAREVLHRIGAMQKMPADSSVVKYALIKQPHPKFSGPAFPEKFGISGMNQVRDAAALEIRDARKKQRALNNMMAERKAQRAVPSPFSHGSGYWSNKSYAHVAPDGTVHPQRYADRLKERNEYAGKNLAAISQRLVEFEKDSILARIGVSGYNKPKRTPNHPTKSHVVVAKSGDQVKTIRFGQQGVKGSPKKEGESESYRKRRQSFKARHAKNIAKGKMSAAFWSNTVKW